MEIPVTGEAEIETPESIVAQRVRAALQDDRGRAVEIHHGLDDRFEQQVVTENTVVKKVNNCARTFVVDALTQWHVH